LEVVGEHVELIKTDSYLLAIRLLTFFKEHRLKVGALDELDVLRKGGGLGH
jgi:hypothetical protein